MASSDVRDVLNLPDGHAGQRPSKKQKLAAPRPNLKGLAREVQNLGGDNPIAIVPEVTLFKKRRLASRKPASRWELRAFRNSARDDSSLILRHWRRKEVKAAEQLDKGASAQAETSKPDQAPASQKQDAEQTTTTADDENKQPQKDKDHEAKPDQGSSKQQDATEEPEHLEDSAFAKFNVQVSVPQYSDDQYQSSLQNPDWTKEETDYLLQLVQDFDLRWPLIWDRYEWNRPATNGEADTDGGDSRAVVPAQQSRTMETLKARYYDIAAKMMSIQKPVQYMTQAEFSLHQVMLSYSAEKELARKKFATNALQRTAEEAREEESLLLEIKRILARSERFNEERAELYSRLDYPHTETDISPFRTSNGLQQLLHQLMNVDKSKKRKSLMAGDGVSPGAAAIAAGTPQSGPAEATRRDSIAAPAASRDSVGATAATPTASGGGGGGKKTQPHPIERRKLTDQEEAIYGVTHHDRLGSGPTFRTEKINKLFSHKSNQQQIRINNTLNELDVPAKLAMPTAATTHQYELLLGAVNSLLDARKVTDKVDAEIKVEQARKAEREKALAPPESADKTDNAGSSEAEPAADATKEASVPAGSEDKPKAVPGSSAPEAGAAAAADDGVESKRPAGEEEGQKAETAVGGPTEDDKAADGDTKRPGSSSGASHKRRRSASVLSSVSDKSAKRQKK